jgi:NAD(P)-dependent dehydrogenase (short-subunit alcohol dehydrogenase family)/rhamnose utilization protein RhaD (predicted bifunctional aldolase and dehydrogenase)
MNTALLQIAELSRLYGSDPDYVFLGGGNTSVKIGNMMYIKPSGAALATIQPEQFLAMDRTALQDILHLDTTSMDSVTREAAVKDALSAAVRPYNAGRPSVEALAHHLLEYQFVVHLHPTTVNGLTCGRDGKVACRRLFPDALWLDYCDPGCTLSKVLEQALNAARAERGRQPQVVFLQNHGVFVGADTTAEIQQIYADMLKTLAAVYQQAGINGELDFAPADMGVVSKAAPALRTLLADQGGNRALVHCLGRHPAFAGPLTPDHIVNAKSFAFSGPANRAAISAYQQQHGCLPKVVCLSDDQTLFAVGSTLKEALGVQTTLENALKIEKYSAAFGGPRYLTPAEYTFIENWEAESYRRQVASATGLGRLQQRVCVVTGGAQGFGLGIAEYLAANGAIVVIADLNGEGAAAAAQQLCDQYGSGQARAVTVNIADEESVAAMFESVVMMCGGVDLLVANAGVLRAGSVLEMTKKDWDFVTNINYTGYFLCVKHAARIMARQIVDGVGRWSDIVQVNSKSGLEGSLKNGAYAGSKFGGIGLTQSFAKELVEQCIKVNSVCPGNYYDGPLWSDPEKGLFVQYLATGKVPGAKTVDEVRSFYENKVPLRRGCLPADVAKAIIYCVEQDYETGQAIPVTGGQVMLH